MSHVESYTAAGIVAAVAAVDIPKGIGELGVFFFGWPHEIGRWFGVFITAAVTWYIIYKVRERTLEIEAEARAKQETAHGDKDKNRV